MILQGKVAVVTGGSRGIGRAICLEYAKNGADIAILDISAEAAQATAAEIAALGVRANAYACNIAEEESVKAAFKALLADFGTVDILVNNAGITRDKLMMTMKADEFDSVLSVNLRGAFLATKQVYPIFAKKRSGRIISLASVAGIMGNAGQVNYAASKAGIIGMTKSIAKELASRGVTCNAIAPGFVQTDMTAAFQGSEEALSAIPMRRFARPEEIAALALFLASDAAGYITGEVIRIDGGMAM
ncbi:MAG: 3-oxoacyl-[acyl-carrier-protein] reductase [Eubacteriales bacterium]